MSQKPPFLLLVTHMDRGGVVHAKLHPAALPAALQHAEHLTIRADSPMEIGSIVSGEVFMFKGPLMLTEDANVPQLVPKV